jgi:hypothetical protein
MGSTYGRHRHYRRGIRQHRHGDSDQYADQYDSEPDDGHLYRDTYIGNLSPGLSLYRDDDSEPCGEYDITAEHEQLYDDRIQLHPYRHDNSGKYDLCMVNANGIQLHWRRIRRGRHQRNTDRYAGQYDIGSGHGYL